MARVVLTVRIEREARDALEEIAVRRRQKDGAIAREILEGVLLGDGASVVRDDGVDASVAAELLRVAYFSELCFLEGIRAQYPKDWQERAYDLKRLAQRAAKEAIKSESRPPNLLETLIRKRRAPRSGNTSRQTTASSPPQKRPPPRAKTKKPMTAAEKKEAERKDLAKRIGKALGRKGS